VSSALDLATWIRAHLEYRDDALTHLKLQKLAFYCYGAALAFEFDREIGIVPFEAWGHGPVSPEIYSEFRGYGREKIDFVPAGLAPKYSAHASSRLHEVLSVYGVLDAWALRQESHLEQPWRDASLGQVISRQAITNHFRKKFITGPIRPPEQLQFASSFALDGIPVRGFATLQHLAESVRKASTP
jgi:uncharacterized phage-associated protein